MNYAIILSGGKGKRAESKIPKQYVNIGKHLMLTYSLSTFLMNPMIDDVLVVADLDDADTIKNDLSAFFKEERDQMLFSANAEEVFREKFIGFAKPGESRSQSIFSGLKAIKDYAKKNDLVIIHDAARPFVTDRQISALVRAALKHDGAMPVLPMKDTIYISKDGKSVSKLLNRKTVFAGQAPEAYYFGKYFDAISKLSSDKLRHIHGSTEIAIMDDMDIAMIPGDEMNFKITTKEDLIRCSELMEKLEFNS